MDYLKLIRYPNLLIVALTQFIIWARIPVVFNSPEDYFHSGIDQFILLGIGTMLITAAGYVINDIVDIKIDERNKPEKQYINKSISIRSGWIYYSILNILALLSISFLENNRFFLPFFALGILMLAAYSYFFKKLPLIGNVAVAVFSSMVIGEMIILEYYTFPGLATYSYFENTTLYFYMVYILFSFLTSFMREIVKDIEDIAGDRLEAAKTFPIVAGIKASKMLIALLSGALVLVFIQLLLSPLFVKSIIIIVYILIFLLIPILLFLWKLFLAKNKKDFSLLSLYIKLYMLLGLSLLFLI